MDAVWGDWPPATVAKSIQVYVSRLRKEARGRQARDTLAGLRPARRADRLDLACFRALVGEARRRRPGPSRGELRKALALWRGPALADLAYETFAQPDTTQLDELRLAALEKRIDADLAIGEHGRLIGELEALVAQHPLRERLRGQLMLALAHSGRQADALTACQAARTTLVEEPRDRACRWSGPA